ncbi:MAG: hypothetical protein IPK55_11005 [Streptococcus sp.]|nr:hypothetical protein [Streptococcus sp.]
MEQTPGPGEYELKEEGGKESQLERDSKKESLRIYLLQDNMRSNQE